MIKIIYILLLSSLFFGKQVINEFILDKTSIYNHSFKISNKLSGVSRPTPLPILPSLIG